MQAQYMQAGPEMGQMMVDPAYGGQQMAMQQMAMPATTMVVQQQPQMMMAAQPQVAMVPQQPQGFAGIMGDPIILPLDRTKGPEWDDFNRRRNQTISTQGYTTMHSARVAASPAQP
eukprot:905658-Rhodomonas_salina.3